MGGIFNIFPFYHRLSRIIRFIYFLFHVLQLFFSSANFGKEDSQSLTTLSTPHKPEEWWKLMIISHLTTAERQFIIMIRSVSGQWPLLSRYSVFPNTPQDSTRHSLVFLLFYLFFS